MRKAVSALVALAVVAVAVPALAGEKEYAKCDQDIQTCLNKYAAKLGKRGWTGIEMDQTESGKLRVTRVVPESPAEKAGFQVGDVLTAVNGVAHTEENKAALKEVWDAMQPGKTVTYALDRGGEAVNVEVELGTVPESVMAQWIGQHMLMAHLDRPEGEAEASS